MDYEKKYNEALKWMRELYPGLHGATKEDAEHFFPELRESEDERIRKWLVDYFGSIKEVVWIHRDITCGQILAYLEKQKEQIMKDAVEGVIDDCGTPTRLSLKMSGGSYRIGDKVRVIVLPKEGEK